MLGSGQGHVDASEVIDEANIALSVGADSGKDNDWLLTALPAIDSLNVELKQFVERLKLLLQLDCLALIGGHEAVVPEIFEFLSQLRLRCQVGEKLNDEFGLSHVEVGSSEPVFIVVTVQEEQGSISVQEDGRELHVVL